jgi:hypothetical protein
MAMFPWTLAILTVPRWPTTLRSVTPTGWLGLMGWGGLFGIASLLYGLAVDLQGIALGFAIQLGLSIVLGAHLPMLWARALSLRARGDWVFLSGLAVMVAGVILCAQAGGDKSAGPGGGRPPRRDQPPAYRSSLPPLFTLRPTRTEYNDCSSWPISRHLIPSRSRQRKNKL